LGEDLPPGLAREGDLMLGALLREIGALPSVSAISMRDPRLPAPDTGASFLVPAAGQDIWDLWERALDAVDALWPIAPETGGALERMSRLAASHGKRLLGSSPEAVRIAGSKRATCELLARHGIPAVETRTVDAGLPPSRFGWVVKPDDGAGAEDSHIFEDAEALGGWLAGAESAGRVVQPFQPGEAASLSALFRQGRAFVLSCNRQDIAREGGTFRYRGFDVGAREDLRPAFEEIAQKIAKALPGLFGYAGIDLMMTADGPVVLEINPRLTTSYAGLGAALDRNVAGLVLDLAAGRDIPALRPKHTVRVAVEGGDG
jgi:predicted ATP-grasp superfamily ATP-dependent carboligase